MPKFAANLTMLFTEHDFLDRFAAARQAGFTAWNTCSPTTTRGRNWPTGCARTT